MSKPDRIINALTYLKVMEFKDQLETDELEHLIDMTTQIPGMKDTRKINRWLGFIHGQLVAYTSCTVEELKDICREENK